MHPLSIAITCFPTFGGSGVIASEIALGLAERGHRVSVIARSRPVRLVEQAAGADGAGDGGPVTFHEVTEPVYAPLLGSSAYAIALASKIIEVSNRESLDILHVHYAVPHATAAWMARAVLASTTETESASPGGRPRWPRLVTTLHGTDITLVGADPSYLPITRHSIVESDAVTTPSHFLREETYRRLAVPRSTRIDVIPNFVDVARYAPGDRPTARRALASVIPGLEDDEAVLFHVSNLRPVKRAAMTLDILAGVQRVRPARLVMVGDGPDRGDCAKRAEALGLTERVSFLGEREAFEELLAGADVFLLPSESESFGLAALEALSTGIPVVASATGGLPEVVRSGVTGYLCPVGDVDTFTARVLALLEDRPRWLAMSAAARADVLARFQRGPALDAYEQAYLRARDVERP